ncbi:MAG: transglutaminase domain-containing protein [Planctomycetota bacterium]|nr:transglutaminase domain-containing protein [Planctomycetota bacterium]
MRYLLPLILLFSSTFVQADELLQSSLERAKDNRTELELALKKVPKAQREGMEFLIRYMPHRDLTSLKADFLLLNVKLAYQAWETSPWHDQIPKDIFLNDILPYASISETREDWRSNFLERFGNLVKDAKTPSEAAAILNNNVFKELNVKYSTQRKRPDQSPSESIEQGLASCSGLSVVLIDACRAVGIPARFAGTPLWSNRSGNHSWVEIYDDGWHFTGACEATGADLNKGWFVARAATAVRDNPIHAIYATSYKRTPIHFPMVWDWDARYVYAVNVTDRYTRLKEELPEGFERVMFVAFKKGSTNRIKLPLIITDTENREVYSGHTNDESFDRNDHVSVPLKTGNTYHIKLGSEAPIKIKAAGNDQLLTFNVPRKPEPDSKEETEAPDDDCSGTISLPATNPLSANATKAYVKMLWTTYSKTEKQNRQKEHQSRVLKIGELSMPFWYKVNGDKPQGGRSLFISMHGGGGAPAAVNDGQYENQKRLYNPEEGVYFVPRAPTNTWNLWHQGHIDGFFQRVIENMVLFEDVNPNRVYIMGYSAGGDGVYQLAPRLADRLAAAAMMAGHPNETRPDGLRNLPFTLHMGAQDGAYNRNKKAAEWKTMLADLHQKDPGGYINLVKLHEGKGHWMTLEDRVAVPWMAKHTRNNTPDLVVWRQDDVTHDRFYWLAVHKDYIKGRSLIRVKRDGQTFTIEHSDVAQLLIRVNDDMIDFNKKVTVIHKDKVVFNDKISRSSATIEKTFQERHDPTAVFSAEIKVNIPQS